MSPQETQVLQDFLSQLTQVRGIQKDPQADTLIAAAVAQQPDAAYLLVQRALLMEQALNASKSQIATLQEQVRTLQAGASPAPAPGFFDSNAWGHAPTPPLRANPVPPGAPPAYVPPAPAAAAPYQPAPMAPAAAPAPSPGFLGGGMGSMLGTVAATAAGVAGGAFLYQGIEHMMHGNNGSGFMHQNGLSSPVETIENTTVNNYYGSDGDRKSGQSDDTGRRDRDDGNSNSAGNDGATSNDFADISDIDLDDNGGYDDSVV